MLWDVFENGGFSRLGFIKRGWKIPEFFMEVEMSMRSSSN
jgi:hypothetical protein